MCLDNILLNKKKQKVEISVEDFEELVKAYTELKDLKVGLEKMHFLSGLSYEELSKINWTSFAFLPENTFTETLEKLNTAAIHTIKFEGYYITEKK